MVMVSSGKQKTQHVKHIRRKDKPITCAIAIGNFVTDTATTTASRIICATIVDIVGRPPAIDAGTLAADLSNAIVVVVRCGH